MKDWLQSLVGRIDALSLRERVFLFISLLACILALADVLLVSPAQTQHGQLARRFAAQNDELAKLREELKSINATSSVNAPGKQSRDELQQIKARLQQVTQEIDQLPLAQHDALPLQQVLTQFLRRHEGLSLVRTVTLPPLTVQTKRAEGSTAPKLKRQRLELTVAGPYPQLVRYVQALEQALPALRWGEMQVNSESQPPQLRLQVSLVGESKYDDGQ